jgi:transcriptional regulator with XRE-family HTH domain
MQSLKEIREKFSITQRQLAEFLNISRDLLARAENGSRSLPTPALLKLNKLYSLSTSLKVVKDIPKPADEQKQTDKLSPQPCLPAGRLNITIQRCRLMANKLQGDLDAMISLQHKTIFWHQIVQQLLSETVSQHERLWLEIQLETARRKLLKCNTAKQLQLRLKIHMLFAEAEFSDMLLKELDEESKVKAKVKIKVEAKVLTFAHSLFYRKDTKAQ